MFRHHAAGRPVACRAGETRRWTNPLSGGPQPVNTVKNARLIVGGSPSRCSVTVSVRVVTRPVLLNTGATYFCTNHETLKHSNIKLQTSNSRDAPSSRLTWHQHIIEFYSSLKPPEVPAGIGWLFPQQDPEVMKVVDDFYGRFYNDTRKRKLFLGINPGRFGAGVTGVNFTAPRQLTECGVPHPFRMQSELSAEFIYEMIHAYGGPKSFYGEFFIGSVCPLGFIKSGKNINYYDDPALLRAVTPFITEGIDHLLSFQADRSVCFCIGGEKNFRFLSSLNLQNKWFRTIIPLPHPRFIMQYRRKQKQDYIRQYLEAITP
ncbi:MAG TPA: uracil-DNA glycosylase family protein [Flavisolibacter sp.]